MALKKQIIVGVGALAGSVAVSGVAHAGTYTYGANAAGNVVVIAEATKVASSQAAGLIGSRVSNAVSSAIGGGFGGGGGAGGGMGLNVNRQSSLAPSGNGLTAGLGDGKGKASGSAPQRAGVWLNGAYNWLENKQEGAKFDGGITNVMGGADYLVTDRILVGLAAGYENQDIKTKFNNGKMEGNGLTLAPYFAFILNKNISFDLTVGHSWVDYDVSRGNGSITGSTNGDRWFSTVNANYGTTINNWQLGAALGYLYTQEKQDAYNESNGNRVDATDTHLGQARLTGKVGYLAPTSFGYLNPYGSARLEYDLVKDAPGTVDAAGTLASHDNFGVTFGLGVAAGIGDATTVNLEGTTTQFRDNQNVYGVSGTVRYKF